MPIRVRLAADEHRGGAQIRPVAAGRGADHDGNVGGINVVVRTRLPSDDPGSSAEVAKEIFKAQVEKLNS